MLDFFLVSLTSILFVVDPLGTLPAYLAMTSRDSREKRRRLAVKASLTAGLTLLVFAIAGRQILHLFGISLPAFRIAGGLVLLLVAFDMIRAQRATQEGPGEVAEGATKDDIAITPLAIPMLAGPASLSAVTVLMTNATSWSQSLAVHLAIGVTTLICYLVLLSAEALYSWFGRTGIHVFSRILGLVLAAISVQFIIDGIREAGFGQPATATSSPTDETAKSSVDQSRPFAPATLSEFRAALDSALSSNNGVFEFDGLVNDDHLAEVTAATILKQIILPETDITDKGLEHIATISNLEVLVLGQTSVTDAGIASISPLTKLKRLSFDTSSVSDEGLAQLASLTDLESLRIGSSKIGGTGLRAISKLPKLRFLILQNAAITDDPLAALHSARSLESVYLEGNPLRGEGVGALKTALPKLHIHW